MSHEMLSVLHNCRNTRRERSRGGAVVAAEVSLVAQRGNEWYEGSVRVAGKEQRLNGLSPYEARRADTGGGDL